MTYVLIILLFGYRESSSSGIEFSTKEACQLAADWINGQRDNTAKCFNEDEAYYPPKPICPNSPYVVKPEGCP